MSSPRQIIEGALEVAANQPHIRRVCLTSGGGDSTVLAHVCRPFYDELVHIDTGTALPGVRDFVEDFGRFIGRPLRVVEAGDAFRMMVLGPDEWWDVYARQRRRLPNGEWQTPDEYRDEITARGRQGLNTRAERMAGLHHLAPTGFPGPAGHAKAYQRLKERQLERELRNIKSEHGNGKQRQRVALLSGVRLHESARRKMTGTARGEWERKGNQLWINPLAYWTNEQMRLYREEHQLPVSDVTALLHKSGECQCLAFAAKGEREFIVSLFPEWYATVIRPIEETAYARGLKHWQWGWGAGIIDGLANTMLPERTGPMCSSCDSALAARG